MLGVTVRLTRPSRSRFRRVNVSILCEMPGIERFRSLNRRGPNSTRTMISTLHLSPIEASQPPVRSHPGSCNVRSRSHFWSCGYTKVPSCGAMRDIYTWFLFQ
jgi:hypothetical protein